MAQAKPFKLELWMLVVPIGIGIAVFSAFKSGSVELGGACTDRGQCKKPADTCLSLPDQQICTETCAVTCPSGFECVSLNVRVHAQGFVNTQGGYCFRPELAAQLAKKP